MKTSMITVSIFFIASLLFSSQVYVVGEVFTSVT